MSTPNKKSLKHFWFPLFFAFVFFISASIRIISVSNFNVAFTSDQARDMLEIREIAVLYSPKLIGPITDIIGLYLGPFWYYFNLAPFLISGGNPVSLVYFSILIFHVVSALVFFHFYKRDMILGFLTSSILLLSPAAYLTTRYSFNANAVLYFSALFPLFIFLKTKSWSFFEGLLCGIILQLQAAIGILFFPISFVVHFKREKNQRHLLLLTFGFFITLVPQIIFELSHKFVMTKSLFAEFFGNSSFLGTKLTLSQLFENRLSHFLSIFSSVSSLPVVVIFLVIALAIAKKGNQSMGRIFLKYNSLLIFVFFVFFLLFPYGLKDWYLYGIVPFAVYTFASAIAILSDSIKLRKYSTLLFCLVIYTSIVSSLNYLNRIHKNPSNDPSSLGNMLKTVEKVYQEAGGQSFRVYSYFPSVYDYPYQYLFWWYGTKKFAYQPAEISYLPDVPEYVRDNNKYWSKTKNDLPINTYLIIQHDDSNPEREQLWRSRFSVKKEKVIVLPWNTTIEKVDNLLN